MKKSLFTILILAGVLLSCKKETINQDQDQDQAVNSWTFKAQGNTYKGELWGDPLLNTFLQSNNRYNFAMLGVELNSGRIFNIVMSLADTTFSTKNYQSGLSEPDYVTMGFYFSEGIAGEDIYKSSNLDPGPVMNYNIESYNATTRVLIMTFQGNVHGPSGTILPVTDGKLTCKVDKF